jgi:hypothetical protein
VDGHNLVVKVTPDTKLSELLARPRRRAPPGVLVSDALIRSVRQSLQVEGHEVSEEAVRRAAHRVLPSTTPDDPVLQSGSMAKMLIKGEWAGFPAVTGYTYVPIGWPKGKQAKVFLVTHTPQSAALLVPHLTGAYAAAYAAGRYVDSDRPWIRQPTHFVVTADLSFVAHADGGDPSWGMFEIPVAGTPGQSEFRSMGWSRAVVLSARPITTLEELASLR